MTTPSFASLLQGFFTNRLMQQRQASPHTIASYRDSFRLLLQFAQKRIGVAPQKLSLEQIDAPFIAAFLEDMQTRRGICTGSRNLRLTAIRSFFRYASFEMPTHAAQIQRVLTIPNKRYTRAQIGFLTREETDALLRAPDLSTRSGRRDHALMLLAVQTGLRLSEFTGLCRRNICLTTGAHVRVVGKGRKERSTPLTTATADVLRAWLGGHLLHFEGCGHDKVAYNSCRNRHCPKCQASAAKRWLDARQAELLPVDYYHVVFTLPAPISAIAYYNKAVIYRLLFEVAAETFTTIAADPKHLGAQIGATLVLHTWGSALTHHPHVHGIVPGGGLSLDGQRWVACKPGFFLPVRVLSRLFRRRFLEELGAAYRAGELQFFSEYAELADAATFARWLSPMGKCEWVVYAKRPFAGPAAVLAYLSRYTHRVAIANSRLISMDETGVTFRWKDYRAKGKTRHKTMTLAPDEFMRRFLLHVLPSGFHRIRHYGLIANNARKDNLARARELLQVAPTATGDPELADAPADPVRPTFVCVHCGAPMVIVQTLARERAIRAPPQNRGVP